MGKNVKVVLVGIGGYGNGYLQWMLEHAEEFNSELVGCVDPFASVVPGFDILEKRGIPIYECQTEFYKNHSADLAVISSPIHCHKLQTITALESGSNVLCEKPLAATVEDGMEMIATAAKTGRFAAVGYQLSFSPACLAMKDDILAGRYGMPRRFITYVCWPRWESYYKRNKWAGRIKTDDGLWALDSPVNNATAHYLHNMLFMAGDAVDKSAHPSNVRCELFRAKPIENYDTAAMRIITENGTEIIFLTTHSSVERLGPVVRLEFDGGSVSYNSHDGIFVGCTANGEKRIYGNPTADDIQKLKTCIAAIRGKEKIPCTAQTALPHLKCVAAAQKTPVQNVPVSMIKSVSNETGDNLVYIEGVERVWAECFEKGILPSELGWPE